MYSDFHYDGYQRRHDAAKYQAAVLRRQAISHFWRQLGQAIRCGLQALRRPAKRPQLPRGA